MHLLTYHRTRTVKTAGRDQNDPSKSTNQRKHRRANPRRRGNARRRRRGGSQRQQRTADVNQYRHPVRMNLWKCLPDCLDIDGEDPWSPRSETRRRGRPEADTWNALTDYFSSPGATSEAGRVTWRNLSELPAEERSERTDEERNDLPLGTPRRRGSWYWRKDSQRSLSGGTRHPRPRRTTLKACAPPRWLGVPPLHMGQRREKPENFRNH